METPPVTTSTGSTTGGGVNYAALAQMALQAYQAYNQSKTQSPQRLPEDPSMVALRNKIIGYTQNSPTRNMLGDMLKPAIERSGNSTFQLPQGYGGYNPTSGMNGAPQYDLSKIFGSLATSDNPNPQSLGQQPNAPPPPPDITVPTGKKRTNNVAKGALGGLVGGGLTGGGVGGVVGAITGALGGRKKNEDAWKQGHQAYNDWLKQYGSAFGGTPPKNMDEYKAWYQKTYGRPFQG